MSILGRVYNGSFDGVQFFILTPLNSYPIVQAETQYHKPTTDENVTIDMGKSMRNWEQKVAIDAVDLDAIESKVGVTGSYVFHRGTTSAKLKGISAPEKASGWDTYSFTLYLSRDN